MEFIEEEKSCLNYDNVAELYRFLSLTNEEKDKEGFNFYSWIWEDGKWDNWVRYYSFMDNETHNHELVVLANMRKKL